MNMIRKANRKDIPRILKVYKYAHHYMRENNNPHQWPSYYPGLIDIEDDISKESLYVLEDNGQLIGVFALCLGEDENYQTIYDGKWRYPYPYGTIHRIASLPNDVHFADQAFNYCKSIIGNLRVDTHEDNKKMRYVVEKNGFSYSGNVFVRKDQPRLAYEYCRYQKIYIAGGCFWGVEHYYSLLKGVITTRVGYANGDIENPSYEQVKHHEATHAETVEVVYDPTVITLPKILEHFLRFVDPYSIDKQGEDRGHQYRSGIYFTSPDERQVIKNYLDGHIKGKYNIEILPLENFYDAEEYHQDYLYKNPNGYCHINMRLIKDKERK